MSLRETLNEELKKAMKAREADRVGIFRLIFADIKQKEVDGRKTLEEAEILSVLEKMVKQRKESIAQFSAAGRHDLADKEKNELSLIQSFMPQALSEAELQPLIAQAIERAQTDSGKTGAALMGAVIGALRPLLAGRADMAMVSAMVKKMLAS